MICSECPDWGCVTRGKVTACPKVAPVASSTSIVINKMLSQDAKEEIVKLYRIGVKGALLQALAMQGALTADIAEKMIEVNVEVFREELGKI